MPPENYQSATDTSGIPVSGSVQERVAAYDEHEAVPVDIQNTSAKWLYAYCSGAVQGTSCRAFTEPKAARRWLGVAALEREWVSGQGKAR